MIQLQSFALFSALVLASTVAVGADETLLLRFPDIHGDRVVFTYGGDLWLAPSLGGTATRLTSHPGLELFARFAPDGTQIAFTGQYDGDEQVYVVPAAGGVPRRLTHYPARGPLPPRWGYDNQVYGWTPDGEAVLFRSMREGWTLTGTRLFTVSLKGGLPTPLAMPVSGGGDLSPDGKKVVYSPLVRDFRTWKRYQGGWAQDLYVFDLETNQATRLTRHPRSERDPMWIGDRIYYVNDATGTLNLYARSPSGGNAEQLTSSETWDVRWPAACADGQIVYELGGRLHVFDTKTGKGAAIRVVVPDDGVASRPSRVDASGNIESSGLSPDGNRAVFVARGDVFTVPAEHGPTRNITRTSDAHEKWAAWSPDGAHIVYLGDQTGEEELYLRAQHGRGSASQLTHGGTMMRYRPRWSPDSERIAFADKSGRLHVITVENRQIITVADNPGGPPRDYRWSPCGQHIALSMEDPTSYSSIFIWSVEDGVTRRITGETFDEHSPAWGPDGDFLFFLSDREFAPQIASHEWNYAQNSQTGIFVMALRGDVRHPFPPRSDEVETADEKVGAEGKDGGVAKKNGENDDAPGAVDNGPEAARIDFDGLAGRVARVPIPPGNLRNLAAVDGSLIYARVPAWYYGRGPGSKPSLHRFELEARRESTIVEGASFYSLSADGKSMLTRVGPSWKLLSGPAFAFDAGKTLSTAGLKTDRVPEQEWEQIYDEVWRRFRDFFYVANMHGYDWKKLGRDYRTLLEHVAHRSDLNYVIGELIGELNVSHAYIAGGDWMRPEREGVALLGARLVLDSRHGRYRIDRILKGHNEEERYRSPLTEIGVDVSAGDYLLAIDGETLEATDNPYELLRHKASIPVTLTVSGEPALEGAREVTIRPVSSEQSLNYLDWVIDRRERVRKATDGRVGYIHVPDMGDNGIREFIKWYYGQVRKEGLVVDVRYNGGGNVSQMLIERLRRRLLGTGFARNIDFPTTYPGVVFHGHMVCVLNENSASDGDIFPHMFRQAGLGPLIGKRSWGGVIGITSRGPLIDGGTVNVPEFGMNGVDGSWILEGHGVDPDIVVEQDPEAVIEGRDPQLERAIAEVLEAMERGRKKLPARPEDPVRTE